MCMMYMNRMKRRREDYVGKWGVATYWMLMFLNNGLQQELWPNVLHISFPVNPVAAVVPRFFLSSFCLKYEGYPESKDTNAINFF
jgi:hypothetical protein